MRNRRGTAQLGEAIRFEVMFDICSLSATDVLDLVARRAGSRGRLFGRRGWTYRGGINLR